jgi:hypothetical protein
MRNRPPKEEGVCRYEANFSLPLVRPKPYSEPMPRQPLADDATNGEVETVKVLQRLSCFVLAV